jgi:hypothetical protein
MLNVFFTYVFAICASSFEKYLFSSIIYLLIW